MDPLLSLAIANEFTEVERLSRSARAFLEPRGVPPSSRYTVDLVLEEIVTNIIKYAYDDTARHEITVRLRLGADSISIAIEDDGAPFDPLSVGEPEEAVSLADRRTGGYGLQIVRQFAREIRYQRCGDRNRLEVLLALDDPS